MSLAENVEWFHSLGIYDHFCSVSAKILAFPMRRFSAISLLLLMMLPVLMPLTALGQDEDASLPMCCRRHGGKRCHCAMMMAYLLSRLPGTKLMATPVPCPDCPATVAPMACPGLQVDATGSFFADLVSHPATHAQSDARARIALDRAWRKRGPPAFFLS